MNNTYSLRRRLIAWVSMPLLLVALLTALLGFIFTWHEVEEVSDAQLVHSAKVLLQLTQHEIREDEGFHLGLENPNLSHSYERKIGFRIWAKTALVTQSQNTVAFDRFEAPPGFSDHQFGAHKWRFFVFLDPTNNIQIEVSERYDVRYELISEIMSALIIPGLIFLPLIFIILWVGIRQVFKPVVKLSHDVDQRSSQDLAPIKEKDVAEEIAPMILALNRLFTRIDHSFKRERDFTDHAAHELRTPLAAMKVQTQVLIKKLKNAPDCADGLENLQASIDRATRLVGQLLSLARLQNGPHSYECMDLSACLNSEISALQDQASKKSIAIETHIHAPLYIKADDVSMMLFIRNILDNAIKYTPHDGTVCVSLTQAGHLTITDTGAGIDDAEKKTVFQKFTRADKTGQSGSGLGLSIVDCVAAQYGINITLQDNIPHGLNISAEMPKSD